MMLKKILRYIVLLLGKDLETNETTAVAMQRRGKHARINKDTIGNGVMQPFARQLKQL
jgi:hypothetical protein